MKPQCQAILNQTEHLSHQYPLDESVVQDLKGAYNQIVMHPRDQNSGLPCDILNIFPPEIWAHIIDHAMPRYDENDSLLQLTLVSNKWREALVSTPTLWSRIQISGADQDSLAKNFTFIALSRQVSVSIFVSAPPLHDRKTMRYIMTSIGSRLHEVVIYPKYAGTKSSRLHTYSEEVVSIFEDLAFGVPNLLSNVTRIHLEDGNREPMYRELIKQASKTLLAPNLDPVDGWFCDQRIFQNLYGRIRRLQNPNSGRYIEGVLVNSIFPPESQIRKIATSAQGQPLGVPLDRLPQLHNLTLLTYRSGYRDDVTHLVNLVAPQLVQLVLKLPISKLDTVKMGLQAGVRLQRLLLLVEEGTTPGIEAEGDTNLSFEWDPTVSIPALRYLNIWVVCAIALLGKEERASVQELISALSQMYTGIESAFISFGQAGLFTQDVLRMFSTHTRLQSLSLDGVVLMPDSAIHKIVFKHMDKLRIGDINILALVNMPRLCSLKFAWVNNINWDTIQANYTVGKVLIIRDQRYWRRRLNICLPVNRFPALTHLSIHFKLPYLAHPKNDTITVNSFPYLSSITILIKGTPTPTPYATMFCFQLLCQLECCPSLSEINFINSPPEWDILFLMLERRNFLESSGSRSPFAEALHIPLALILGGTFSERPSNEDLLLGGAREHFLDEKLPGCYLCMLNMITLCKAKLKRSKREKGDAAQIRAFLAWLDPPETASAGVFQWMKQRKALIQEFLSRFDIWDAKYGRETSCFKDRKPIRITEYDVPMDV